MKIIISENKIEKIALKWLDKTYGDLEIVDEKKYPENIDYRKGGEMIFNYNIKTNVVYINNSFIWFDLRNHFGMTYKQIQRLTKKWIEDRFGLKVSETITWPTHD
jgi:hypothetical protein